METLWGYRLHFTDVVYLVNRYSQVASALLTIMTFDHVDQKVKVFNMPLTTTNTEPIIFTDVCMVHSS